MPALFRGRRAVTLENERLQVTVLEGGGHIAEVRDRRTGISPLWTPTWPSMEPDTFDAAVHRQYGDGAEARLLSGIMGHNICLDLFGAPSPAEAAAGMTVHGEAPVTPFEITVDGCSLTSRATLPIAQMRFERRLTLHGSCVHVQEIVENLAAQDRPIGWTQHVTLGPPFLQKGATEFRASVTRSQVYERRFGDSDYLAAGARFEWPTAPMRDGRSIDLQIFTSAERSSADTTHLVDLARRDAFFVAFTPEFRLAFGYVWRRADFPWLGIWEENSSRSGSPWHGRELTRGMEFGVSPFPETRREMIDRGRWFCVPGFTWLQARSHITAEYWIVTQHASRVPETLSWPAASEEPAGSTSEPARSTR
jgi:hypothetical protein